MEITLKKPVARNSAAGEFDVRQVKKALNRLGLYMPLAETGITGIPDAAMFNAIKTFQENHELESSGILKPGDETVKALNRETSKEKADFYIWRTVGDEKVRESHAALEGDIRSWADEPDPGEEINCRCWAEPVDKCVMLDIDLQNAELQRKSELEAALEFNEQAKEYRKQLDVARMQLQEQVREAGFDISASFVPGLDGKIPIIAPILESAKNAAEIWTAYQKYLRLWDKLKLTIENQRWFLNRLEEKDKEIIEIVQKQEEAGCSP